uniref:Uncharacterized protein n=1 Tax=Aegilops tauschii subsp. strangulata TaxID=200361 RepID=A0A453A6L2_AEGTS
MGIFIFYLIPTSNEIYCIQKPTFTKKISYSIIHFCT